MPYLRHIHIHDSTLRDGNHAIKQAIDGDTVSIHCDMANDANLQSVEVGHGNGLGASSYHAGFAELLDGESIDIARKILNKPKLVTQVMPGCALYDRDIVPAIEKGVDIFRVGVHCTEADLTKRFIKNITLNGRVAHGALMMSHMATIDQLLIEASKIYDYGAEAVCIYDSAGVYHQTRVEAVVTALKKEFMMKVGFHGHNNLGLAIANSLTAVECGADIIDATICGFGAGAGNTQLEVLVTLLERRNYMTGIDIPKLYDLAKHASATYAKTKPFPSVMSIATAINGLFSGFAPHILKAASIYSVDPYDLMRRLGERGLVGGQEDLIYATASEMLASNEKKNN